MGSAQRAPQAAVGSALGRECLRTTFSHDRLSRSAKRPSCRLCQSNSGENKNFNSDDAIVEVVQYVKRLAILALEYALEFQKDIRAIMTSEFQTRQ